MTWPVEKVVKKGLLLCHESIQFINKNYSHDLSSLLKIHRVLLILLLLALVVIVGVESMVKNLNFVALLEEFIQKEGSVRWCYFLTRDLLINNCVYQIRVS